MVIAVSRQGAAGENQRDDSPSSSRTFMTPDYDSEDSGSDHGSRQTGQSFRLEMGRTRNDEQVGLVEGGEVEDEYTPRGRGRGSFSTVHSYQLYTPDEERAVVRKFDRKLVLFVAVLYMLSFLDRSNIGNARIAGLSKDLELDGTKYEWLITAFYIAYICFEWMSVLWKIIPAHIYVTVIVLSWGIIASLQAVTTTFAGLLVLRVLLGIGEAGFTGIPFYLSFFFKREELALRTGFFVSAAPLAISFASTLAWAIVKLGDRSPIASWRLLFLVEGFPSIIIAVLVWYRIPDSPDTAAYLSAREKKVARLRLRNEKSTIKEKAGLNTNEILRTMTDPKSYLTAFMFFLTNMAFSSMPVFLPTIIHDMGHSLLISQALSAPPYLASFFVVIATAYLSDRLRTRSTFIIFHALVSASGYALMACAGTWHLAPWIRYLALFPANIGFFSVITLIVTWTINNQASQSAQGTGFAMLQLIGQCGPLIGTRLYPERDKPYYVVGMSVCAAAMVGVAMLAGGLRWWLGRCNRLSGEGTAGEGKGEDERLVVKGRRAEPFRFML